jgi:colanic acid biosynthesis glycosyl transferase WcaI
MLDLILQKNIDPEKVIVIPHWPDVSTTLMDHKKPTRQESKNPYILENTFTVIYSGNFGLIHDFDVLVDAMKIVQQSGHPIRFIMAGDGRKFDSVRAKTEALGLNNVHFVRAQPQEKFLDMLLAGDLHVATVIPEVTGMAAPSKINSALGLERPCLLIGSKHSFQAKLITEYNAGKVVDANDPQAKFQAAEAIIQYATDLAYYQKAKENALKAAEAISFEKGVAAFDAVFSKIIAS